jgi:hypothetical protein
VTWRISRKPPVVGRRRVLPLNADCCMLFARRLPLHDDPANGLSLRLSYSHEVDAVRHESAMLITRHPELVTLGPQGNRGRTVAGD